MPLISIIIPIYNTEKYLPRCIDSILAQTFRDFELLLINDGSTDNSGTICDEYVKKDSRIRVFHKENGGASSARNMGLDNAQGEWIAFIDSDDWIDTTMYESMFTIAKKESVDAVYCDIVMHFEYGEYNHSYNCEYEDHRLMYDCLVPIDVVYFSMCNKLVAKKVYDNNNIRAIHGANMWEDVELAIRTRYFVRESKVINKGFYHYNCQNQTSTTHAQWQHLLNGQIERVQQIEDFFIRERSINKYKHFVSQLKLHVKKHLFEQDLDKWTNTFKEAKWSLWRMQKVFTQREIIKYLIVSFLGKLGRFIINTHRK